MPASKCRLSIDCRSSVGVEHCGQRRKGFCELQWHRNAGRLNPPLHRMDWSSCPPLPPVSLPGWIGWTEVQILTVAWAALDGVGYKMTALKHLEYQDQSVGGVHRFVSPIKPGVGVLTACVYNERGFASVASPRDPGRLVRSRIPPSQVCTRQFS
jgi:hypothetical protein